MGHKSFDAQINYTIEEFRECKRVVSKLEIYRHIKKNNDFIVDSFKWIVDLDPNLYIY